MVGGGVWRMGRGDNGGGLRGGGGRFGGEEGWVEVMGICDEKNMGWIGKERGRGGRRGYGEGKGGGGFEGGRWGGGDGKWEMMGEEGGGLVGEVV